MDLDNLIWSIFSGDYRKLKSKGFDRYLANSIVESQIPVEVATKVPIT